MAALRDRLLAPTWPEGHDSARRSIAMPCPRPFQTEPSRPEGAVGSGGLEGAAAARGLYDLVAAQAPRAGVDVAHPAVDQGAHALEVRVPHPLGDVVSMAHLVAPHRALTANITSLSHGRPPDPCVCQMNATL